ncbi:hypothetical protein B0H14DRAFT_51305 [Mycena olivaceomarginata]|nr:hypothetical protein B0H14DRAFT_51305 [Mycena olivaceomarginata]
MARREGPGRFEWVDGPLIRAMKQGDWLLLDGANLCNPSVLDRLNSLCEVNGFLTLSERGYVDGLVQILRPHPNFRIFMSVDPQYGELSRAMRNRGIEDCPLYSAQPPTTRSSCKTTSGYLYLPLPRVDVKAFDAYRRGLVTDTLGAGVPLTSSGRLLDQDSSSSSLLDRSCLATGSSGAFYHFLARTSLLFIRSAFPAVCSASGEFGSRSDIFPSCSG